MTSISVFPGPSTSEPPVLTFEQLAELSDGQVKEHLSTWAGRVAAGEARLLAYISELDARRGWIEDGIVSCQAWLSWRLGMGLSAAYERLRVARGLRKLPLTFAAFQQGQVSFSQVRALTRMPAEGDEECYLALARHASAAQLEKLAGGMRRAARLAEDDRRAKAGEPVPGRKPRVRVRYDADGDLMVTLRVPAASGQLIIAAIDAACTDLDADAPRARQSDSSAEESRRPRASKGEGIVALAKAYLQARAEAKPKRARRDRAKLTCQVDPLSGWVRLPDDELLPPWVAAAEGLRLPHQLRLRRLRRRDLTRYDAGRTRREPDQRLRDLIGTIDGERCRYPGCRHTRRLHAHHVVHWLRGGRTDFDNLILLCEQHHVFVHREGIRLTLDPRSRQLTVATAGGTAVPDSPAPPWSDVAELDPSRRIVAEVIRPELTDRHLDLRYAVEVLLHRASLLSRTAA